MKNTDEVLKTKELELEAVKKEVEALRIVAPLLVDSGEAVPKIPARSEDWSDLRNGTNDSRLT